MGIGFGYSPWWILACIAVAVLYAGGLYFKNSRNQPWGPKIHIGLAILRFLSVFLLCFLLLSPVLESAFRTVEKPIVVFVSDASASIPLNSDSTYYRTEYKAQVEALSASLSENYEVAQLSFGESVRAGIDGVFEDKFTNMTEVFDELEARYTNRNLGAVIFASDGLYTKGTGPLQKASLLNVPIYTLALGDTTIRKDLLIQRVASNKVVFLNNQFPIEVQVDARKLKGNKASIQILKNGQVLKSTEFVINGESQNQTFSFVLEAKEPGVQRYSVQLTRISGEVTYLNNSADVYVDVLDGRQKIGVFSDAPHPDISALQMAISRNQNYQVEVSLLSDFKGNVSDYSLIIFYQLPSGAQATPPIITQAQQAQIPIWFVLGNNSNIGAFNALNTGVRITGNKNNADDVFPLINTGFGLFAVPPGLNEYVNRFPPLSSPYGNYEVSTSATSLFYRKIGSVATQSPLLFFANTGSQKVGVLTGEGIWKWRLYEYQAHGSHVLFDELISKIVQYLAVKEDKSLFRVNYNPQFDENEPVLMDAEVYNQSYELTNESEVIISIEHEDGRKFPFTFSRSGQAYRLNAGLLPAGGYSFIAETTVNGKKEIKAGKFTVKAIQLEALRTVADHQLLFTMAQNTGGKMVAPRDMATIADMLAARSDIVATSHIEKQVRDFIHIKWIFVILLILLSTEWFIRKREGGY